MDINQIKEILPHRYPFLLIDRVISIDGNKIVAIKNVTANENYFSRSFSYRACNARCINNRSFSSNGGSSNIK